MPVIKSKRYLKTKFLKCAWPIRKKEKLLNSTQVFNSKKKRKVGRERERNSTFLDKNI